MLNTPAQESGVRGQKLEFRVGVGEWNCRFFIRMFIAETQGRRVRRGVRGQWGSYEFVSGGVVRQDLHDLQD